MMRKSVPVDPKRIPPRSWAAAILLLLVLPACLTPSVVTRTRHYPLEPAPEVAAAAATDRTLGIRPLDVARPYAMDMAAYLGPGKSLEYRDHEVWAERPGDVVTRAVTDAIAATGRFRDAGDAAEMAFPDFILTGEVRKFREDRTSSPPAAEIEVRFEVRESQDQGAPWAETLCVKAPMQDRTTEAFAAAMTEAIEQIAEQAAQAVAKIQP